MHVVRRLAPPALLSAAVLLVGLNLVSLANSWGIAEDDRVFGALDAAWRVALALSLATFVVRLLDLVVWDAWVGKRSGKQVPQLPRLLTATMIYVTAAALVASKVFQQPIVGFWTTSGVLGLVLGLALRNIVLDVFMGLAVNMDRSYGIGDWISIPQTRSSPPVVGKVEQIEWRTTRIRQEDGTSVIIPNSQMGLTPITHYGADHAPTRFELPIHLDFAVPTERARRVLLGAAISVTDCPGFASEPAPQVLVHDVGADGVEYLVRFWITPWNGASPTAARDVMTTALLRDLSQSGLTPAYPKEDVYHAPMPIRNLDSRSERDQHALLRGVSLFDGLLEEQLEQLSHHMVRRVLPAESMLIRRGDTGDSMFILGEGLLEVLASRDHDQPETRVALLQPGDFFGELSLLTGEPRSASIAAVTECLIYEIQKDHFAPVLDDAPDLAKVLSEAIALRKRGSAAALSNTDEVSGSERTDGLAQALLGRIRAFFGRDEAAAS